MQVRCNVCAREWCTAAERLLIGKGCKRCEYRKLSARFRFTITEVLRRIAAINPEIEVIESYIGTHTPILCPL